MAEMSHRWWLVPWVAAFVATLACRSAPEADAGAVGAQAAQTVPMQELSVDWDEARRYPRLDDERLSAESVGVLRRSTIPALLPPEQGLVDTAVMTAGPSWYSASMQGDGYSVVIFGSNRGVRLPDGVTVELPRLGSDRLRVDRAEGIAEVSFRAFAVVYTLSVECEDPDGDAHCANDDFALELAASLRLSGVNVPE